jgi:hypothetical protein
MKTVPLLPPVVTSRPDGPVCVLTDLSSGLEEEYATAERMSRLDSTDLLVADHQDG